MVAKLAAESCEACNARTPRVAAGEAAELGRQIPDWYIEADRELRRDFRFPDFATALRFVNRVGEVAEAEGHHPDITLGWGRVNISIRTHAVGGLTRSDFVLAAKIDALPQD
jgi:4a-hydroxytetrahydrobiopterin dehydratase